MKTLEQAIYLQLCEMFHFQGRHLYTSAAEEEYSIVEPSPGIVTRTQREGGEKMYASLRTNFTNVYN